MPSIHIFFLFFALTAAGDAGATEADLAAARAMLLGGKYAEAAEIYAAIDNVAAGKVPTATLGLARCLAAEGKLDEAAKRLSAAAGDHADLHAELARLAFDGGDCPQAKSRAEEALRLDQDQLLAQWILAELDRTAGRLDEADRGYRRLVSFYNEHEVKQAESLRWIGLAAANNARWNRVSDQFSFLVNELYPEALKLEPDYWPAHYEAGRLFMEKFNQADAAKQFQAALELNPKAAEVHAAIARLALENRDVVQAEKSVARALELNPRLLAGWQMKADLLWCNFQVRETLALLTEKALPLNPVDEETLGRVAACYVLLDGALPPGESTRLAQLIEQVARRNPHAGAFFSTLAEQLEMRNKLPEAERFFLEAIKVMPRQVGPQAGLGMLAMRMGREDEARKRLRAAFKADPFHMRVNNMLEVLDVLDSMATLPGDHVTLKYDGACDKLLARYAGRYLESVYPALCKQFGYEPPEKPLVEIFNQAKGHDGHQWFSARLIGLPYLDTVAASTGCMVAMASPYERHARQFNWARVLRHELVHVVTLQQTHFNMPHWYAEGLAVRSEGYPRPQIWDELLVERVPRGELFDLETINFAFTRPGNSNDWQMAYCQAELYVEYMLSLGGEPCLRKMLDAYAEGLATPEAIRKALGVSQPEFEAGYVAYLKQLTAGLSALKRPSSADIKALLKAHRADVNNADAAAELAYAYLQRGADQEALDLAQAALKLRPKHQLATYVVARLALGVAAANSAAGAKAEAADGKLPLPAEKTAEVVALLEGCLDRRAPQPNVLNLLAGLKVQAGQYEEAARLYELGERLDAINLAWTRLLARVYLLAGNQPKLAETLTRLADRDSDDLAVRKKLAKMALQRQDYATAARWANQALEINVMDAEVHRALAEALLGGRDAAAAIEEYQTAIDLEPDDPQPRFALAEACIQAHQPQQARKVLEALLEMVPDYPGAETLLKSLKETGKP